MTGAMSSASRLLPCDRKDMGEGATKSGCGKLLAVLLGLLYSPWVSSECSLEGTMCAVCCLQCLVKEHLAMFGFA